MFLWMAMPFSPPPTGVKLPLTGSLENSCDFLFLCPDYVQILPIFIAAASTVSQTSSLASSSQPWPGDGTATAAGARGAAEGARGGGGLTRVRCLCRAGEGSCHQTWVKIGGNASSNTFPEAWGGAAEEEEVPRPVSPPAAGLRERGTRRFPFGFTAGPGQDEPARSPGRRREPWQVPEAGAGRNGGASRAVRGGSPTRRPQGKGRCPAGGSGQWRMRCREAGGEPGPSRRPVPAAGAPSQGERPGPAGREEGPSPLTAP